MALPNFFTIGAGKAGTTSLHYYLEQHPEIQMSAIKEPHYFAGPENGFPYTMGRVSDRDEYERMFDSAFPVRGESSPGYTSYPRRQGVPERISGLVPDAKFVYLVRDPIARTISHHLHRVAVEGERRSLSDALADLSDPCAPCICPSRYAMQLERYLSVFSQDRILVIDQADLLADRQSTLAEIFVFLGVDTGFGSERFEDELYKSEERRAYPPGVASFIERTIVPRMQWIPATVRSSMRRQAERALFSPLPEAELNDGLRERLRELYAPDVARLRGLTGKGFPTWSV